MDDRILDAKLVHGYLQILTQSLSRIQGLLISFSKTDNIDSNELLESTELLEQCLYQSRGLPIAANKILRAVQDLKDRSMSMPDSLQHAFQICEQLASECTTFVRDLGRHVQQQLHDSNTNTASTKTLTAPLSTFPATSTPVPILLTSLQKITNSLTALQTHTTTFTNATEYTLPTPPWTLLAAHHQTMKSQTESTTQELITLRSAMSIQTTILLTREQSLEEQAVKIELLEARMKDVTGKAALIADLESLLAHSKTKEVELRSSLAERTRDLEHVKTERNQLFRRAAEHRSAEEEGRPHEHTISGATAREIQDLRTEIASLQGAVRFLRGERQWPRCGDTHPGGVFGGDDESWSWLLDDPPLSRFRALPLSDDKSRPQKQRQAREARLKDVNGVFDGLLALLHSPTTSSLVDLSSTLALSGVVNVDVTGDGIGEKGGEGGVLNSLSSWRPFRLKTAWQVARRVEVWEGWLARRDGVLSKAFVV